MIFTCDNCKRIDSFRSFYSPKEYGKIVQELNDEIENGKLILIVQSCCLSEVDSFIRFAPETIEHYFGCPVCGQVFVLIVRITSHGGYGLFDKLENFLPG